LTMARLTCVLTVSGLRWLETSTVRPSAASPLMRFLIHKMPSGSRPLTGSWAHSKRQIVDSGLSPYRLVSPQASILMLQTLASAITVIIRPRTPLGCRCSTTE
jgi:hypothetical protein